MKPLRSDPSLYVIFKEGILQGLSGTYFDDIIRAGNDGFKALASKTVEIFEMTRVEQIPCMFTGF